MVKVLIGVVVAAFVIIVGFMAIDPNLQQNQQPNITEPIDPDHSLTISIEGEVQKPGTYKLGDNATMGDLINIAGGLTPNADERCFYETTIVDEGNLYYIPPLYDDNDVCSSEKIVKVNLNKDTAEKFLTINGFTESIASSIVSHRESNGDFESIEQIEDVYGIGPATYKKVRNYVYLHE